MPNDAIHGAKQMSYDDQGKKMGYGVSIKEQRIYWEQCLEDKARFLSS